VAAPATAVLNLAWIEIGTRQLPIEILGTYVADSFNDSLALNFVTKHEVKRSGELPGERCGIVDIPIYNRLIGIHVHVAVGVHIY